MDQQAKDPPRRPVASRLNLIAAGSLLLVLIVLGPAILKMEGLFSSNPLRPLATGAMAKFSFKHAGEPEPAVVFTGPQGEMTLARLKGKVVLVNLWASWCVPCISEMPSLDRLQAAIGGPGFEVVALNMDQDRSDALAFLAGKKIDHLPLFRDSHLLMSIAWQEPGIPVSVLYDATGHEIGRLVGAADWSSPQAEKLIKAAMAEPQKQSPPASAAGS